MKIGFSENIQSEEGSGKNKFIHRLAKEMRKLGGVEITTKHPDVYLYIPGAQPLPSAKVNIMRLNGLIINNKEDYVSKNNKILAAINRSDAVVYQNEFCRDAYEKFLGVKKPYECILNGANPKEFFPRKTKNFFLANCKWRPHKRLSTIVDGFIHAVEHSNLDARLVVTGQVENPKAHDKIFYIGWQNWEQVRSLLSEAIATLHLSWIDWCPNAMVESVAAKCPVIYSDSGGHKYVGEGNGIAIKDTQWNFNACDYYNPPKLNIQEIAYALISVKNNSYEVSTKKISIDIIAKNYLKFFAKCLG